jgi:hypothetical protein
MININNILGGIGELATSIRSAITGDLSTDQKTEIEKSLHKLESDTLRYQSEVVIAEARGGWLQRNWRPILMLTITFIIANNYVLYPYASLFTDRAIALDLPPALWGLMKIGVGGYIVGRSGEKIAGILGAKK